MKMQPHERIIVAVDTSNISKASSLINELRTHVGLFKLGFEFFYSSFASMIDDSDFQVALTAFHNTRALLKVIGKDLFVDVKLNDIPNTVELATKAILRMQPAMFNVHVSAGQKAIKAAAENKGNSKLFGVTVLTSIEERECKSIFGAEPGVKVLRFAEMLLDCNADGIICAPAEGLMLRKISRFDKLVIACPNVRPDWAKGPDDQNKDRQMTPGQAVNVGIDMLVLGRPITKPPEDIGSPVMAAKLIAQEIESAFRR